jgi:hypothetical protein
MLRVKALWIKRLRRMNKDQDAPRRRSQQRDLVTLDGRDCSLSMSRHYGFRLHAVTQIMADNLESAHAVLDLTAARQQPLRVMGSLFVMTASKYFGSVVVVQSRYIAVHGLLVLRLHLVRPRARS